MGPELLLEGRADADPARRSPRPASATMEFDSLRLEAWSRARAAAAGADRASAEMRALQRGALRRLEPPAPRDEEEEDAVPLTTAGGEELGVVRFRFACDYAHRQLVREYFETRAS